jgi:hypothetical protein
VAKAGGKFIQKSPRVSITADGAETWLEDPQLWLERLGKREPALADVPSRSRKPRKNRGSGPQRRRARVVLRRIWPKEYPTREEVSDADVWDRFSEAYKKIEAGANPPSKHGKPSLHTVLREMGRKD